MIECPACKKHVDAAAFITGCSHFWRNVDAVRFTCPLCRDVTEARIETAKISLGYTYAAGGPHFCGMIEAAIAGLVAWCEGDVLEVELDGQRWTIPSGEAK